MARNTPGGEKNIVVNKKARFEYEVLETFEAGIALVGAEVKSLRDGRANIGDAFALVKEGEVLLYSLHISPYPNAKHYVPDPLRVRKLLLHKSEIKRLYNRAVERGLTLVPLRLYFKNGKVKVELGLVRGRKIHDKRQVLQERDQRRETAKTLKEYRRG